MIVAPVSHDASFKACPTDGIRTEFGVCRGEPIRRLEDLMLGDVYLAKQAATWTKVGATDTHLSAFSLDLAANLPAKTLKNLAHLIFMTTTGRRTDVYAAAHCGRLYFVSDTAFEQSVEYVLIDIRTREDIMPLKIEPVPVVAVSVSATARQPISTMRLHA